MLAGNQNVLVPRQIWDTDLHYAETDMVVGVLGQIDLRRNDFNSNDVSSHDAYFRKEKE